ncbi:transglycosylase SLT domain-containing protein [Streptomyces albipurpureus]|uniref:Transglycosylase SLT domain-containing protein n=1 Tax=Streptomyces albipurpureus TaxID=2897419 RepID=A0ABT0UT08_9ACTN|nr:transglycosylase SLT domain-containing protein [Streptomyces sp. CWNU-1]MCM2391574.1 transglycosylase SLT domain-containing protein [Streptomyces sp. CWNU-1]
MSASCTRLTKVHRASIAGIAAAGVAAITLSLVPSNGTTETEAAAQAAPVAWQADAGSTKTIPVHAHVTNQQSTIETQVEAAAKAAAKIQAEAKAKLAAAAKKAAAEATAKKRAAEQPTSRGAERKAGYANNLDGWIRQSLDIMKKNGIPGSYDGLHRNIMRESSGDPRAINNWDINAINGVPSKGLLQVIQPTFNAYHVKGTPHDLYHPIANIVAAANYAADRYGTIDNVNGAY